jgi:predicted Zn-dependent protease
MMQKYNVKILFAFSFMVLMILFANFQVQETSQGAIRWHESGHVYSYNSLFIDENNPYYLSFVNAVDKWNAENNFLQFGAEIQNCSLLFSACDIPVSWVDDNCDDWAGLAQIAYTGDSAIQWAYIHFDRNCTWLPTKPDSEEYEADQPLSLNTVALHEIGHTLKLDHDFHEIGIMNYDSNFERLMPDDLEGLDYIYPSTIVNKTDLSVSTQKAFDNVNYLQMVNDVGYAYNGNYFIQLQYTLLNIGTTPANNVMVKFYLQNDEGSQYFLDSSYFDLPARSEGTFNRTINLQPNSIPWGTYKVWVKIDGDNSFVESSESNNALPLPGDVTIQYLGLYTDGSVSDSMPSVNQNFTYNVQVCNQSGDITIFNVHVLGFGSSNISIQNPEIVVPQIHPNQCQSITFQALVISNNPPQDPSGDYLVSMITSYEPSNANFELNSSFDPITIIEPIPPDTGSPTTAIDRLNSEVTTHDQTEIGAIIDIEKLIRDGLKAGIR